MNTTEQEHHQTSLNRIIELANTLIADYELEELLDDLAGNWS